MALRERTLEQQNNNHNRRLTQGINEGDNDEIHSILEFLKEKGVIDNQESISFTLNDKELIVNGKKQPGSLHDILRERFIHNREDALIYEKNGNSTRKTINRNK